MGAAGTARRLLLPPFGRTALKKFDTVSDMVDFRTGISGKGALVLEGVGLRVANAITRMDGWRLDDDAVKLLRGRHNALYKGHISGTGGCSRACAVRHPRVEMDIDSPLGSGFLRAVYLKDAC